MRAGAKDDAVKDLTMAFTRDLENETIAQLSAWANLSSTTTDEIMNAYGRISMAEYDRPQQEAKRDADKAGKVVKLVPGMWGKALGWVTKAFSTGSELDEGEQRYVTDMALAALREAARKKDEEHKQFCKCHPNSDSCQ